MPTVNKLTGKPGAKAAAPAAPPKPQTATPKPPAKPTAPVNRPSQGRQVQTVTAEDVETVDAGAIVKADTTAIKRGVAAMKVPAFLAQATLPETVNDGGQGGYIGFADPQSKNWLKMQAAGLEHGDPFVYADGQYHQCKPLCYFLLMGDTFRTTMEGQGGEFTFVTRDLDTPLRELADQIEGSGPKENRRRNAALKAEPHYCCLMLAQVGDSLVPVRGDFRGTKSGAASSAIIAVKSAEDPDWIRLSEAHKVTAAFPHPWGRVWNVCTTKYKVGRASGNGFYVANCASKPASVDQMNMLVHHFQDDDFLAKLAEAETAYQSRIEFLDRVAANEPTEQQ